MSDLHQVIRETTEILDAHDILQVFRGAGHFASIPPMSVAYFTAALEQSQLAELYRVITKHGYSVEEPLAKRWFEDGPVVQFGCDRFSVAIFRTAGVTQSELLAHRHWELYEGFFVWRLDAKDDILLRLAQGRDQIGHIGHDLRRRCGAELAYIRQWAQRLGVLDRLELAICDKSIPDN